jgi:hypothetical protein
MEPSQQPTTTTVASSPGMFGGRIPSSVAFAVGILLFLLPFAEIKCGSSVLANKTGLDFAMGKEWEAAGGNDMFGQENATEKTLNATKEESDNTQYFAIAALALGVLGLLLSFANAGTGGTGGLVTGMLSAAALIGLMLDLKKNFNESMRNQAMDKGEQGSDMFGLNQLGDTMNSMKPTLDFTAWFYVALIAFLVAAFFCFLRSRSNRA